MFCYKCGHEIPEGSNSCANCNSPAKKRQRVKTRMVLGIVIFFIGVLTGIFTERILLKENSNVLPDDKTSETQKIDTEIIANFKNDSVEPKEELLYTETESNPAASATAAIDTVSAIETAPTIETTLTIEKTPTIETAVNTEAPVNTEASVIIETTTVTETTAINETGQKPQDKPIEPTIETVKSEQLVENGIASFPNETVIKETEPAIILKLPKQKFVKSVIIEEGKGNNYHGTLNSASEEVVFVSNRTKVNGKLTYQCYAKKLSEKEAVRLFDWPGNIWTPEPIPFSDKIVFSSDSSLPEHIFVIDRNTQKAQPLTSGKSKNMMPAVSPDGKKIAFVSNQKGRNSIWVMNVDGSEQSIMTSGAYDDREPRWVDGGKAIVFTRIFENLKKSHILKIAYPEKTITQVIATDRRNWLADVSPDGNYIAYTRSEGQNGSKNSIVLRDFESGSEEILKLGQATENLRPIWAADSMSFIFHSIKKTGRSLHRAIFKREKAD